MFDGDTNSVSNLVADPFGESLLHEMCSLMHTSILKVVCHEQDTSKYGSSCAHCLPCERKTGW